MTEDVSAELVVDNQRLRQLCDQWKTTSHLAIDTEFMRVSTFYPKSGLIQVGEAGKNFLLDPLLLTEWQPFVEILTDPAIVKIIL
jgi:ribonuclease D